MTEVKQNTTIEGLDVVELGRRAEFVVYAEAGAVGETELFLCDGPQVICQVTVDAESDFAVEFVYKFIPHV